MEMIKNFLKKNIKQICEYTLSLIFVCASFFGGFAILINSRQYAMDRFTCKLAETMGDDNDVSKRAILNLENNKDVEKSGYVFRDLMTFSSANHNFGDFRTVVNNKFQWNSQDFHLETQSNFYTSYATDDYGYKYIHIDYDSYSTYFLDSDLINREVGDHQSFILISDVFARKLINYYGLNNESDDELELFKKLVVDETTGTLLLKSGSINLDLRIANIIRTDYLNGIRTQQMYGDFGVFYANDKTSTDKLNFSFEVDLKSNSTCIKNTFDYLKQFEYEPSKYRYSFKTYSDGNYSTNTEFGEAYYSALTKSSQTDLYIVFLVYFALLHFVFALFEFFIGNKIKGFCLITLMSSLTFLIVYGVITIFAYVYPLLSIIPVAFTIEAFLFSFEDLQYYYGKIIKRN